MTETSASPSTSPAAPGSGESDVRGQLLVLWRARLMIVLLAAGCGAAAAAYSLMGVRQFESAATISVSTSRLDTQTRIPPAPEGFVPLMLSPAVAAPVIKDLGLGINTSDFLASIITVRVVPTSPLIKVVAQMPTPQAAADVANRYADEAVAMALRASRLDVEAIESELKDMLDAATARLRTAEKSYDDYRTSARFEMVESEVETLVAQRAELMNVIVDLEGERARLARLEGDLARQQPVTSLRQSVVDDPVTTEAARSSSTPLLGLEVMREAPNDVYAKLDQEVSKARANVASLEQRRRRLAETAGLSGSQVARLDQLYQRESMLERLESERDLARKSYEDVAAKYQGAQLAAAGRIPQLIVVDRAVVPEAPLSRYTARNVVLGIVTGVLAGCVIALARAFARGSTP